MSSTPADQLTALYAEFARLVDAAASLGARLLLTPEDREMMRLYDNAIRGTCEQIADLEAARLLTMAGEWNHMRSERC